MAGGFLSHSTAAGIFFPSLPDHVANDYNTMKAEVLRAYALVPKDYRMKFRSKKPGQSHLDFPSDKREAFTRRLIWEEASTAVVITEIC